MKLTLLTILFCLVSCGKIKVETNVPKKINFGPDFVVIAEFCDNRYGIDTSEAESCFKDYRTFLSPKVTLDLASIQTFCKGNYTTQEEIETCESNLLDIIKNASIPNS